MVVRREFNTGSSIYCTAHLLAVNRLLGAQQKRPKIAALTTTYHKYSHAQHIVDRFLEGYGWEGRHHRPEMDVVSLYVEQVGENDLSRERAGRHSQLKIYPTIADALKLGGDSLAVDGVLLIGEHGKYPSNDRGQTLYPRYEYFKQIVEVYRQSGRSAPVFNDKHLSWNWDFAKEMYDTAKEMDFGFMAGSSLPVTWRQPSSDLPLGESVKEVVCIWNGGIDGGDSALDSRPQDLIRNGKLPELIEKDEPPVAILIEYNDGLQASVLMLNGVLGDFNAAIRLKNDEIISTQFYAPPEPNVVYSGRLMAHVEEMIVSGKAPYSVERTQLTSSIIERALDSRIAGYRKLETPEFNIRYQAPDRTLFAS